jgi:hypothetical protein
MKKLIPAWKDGLRGVQEDLASAILGGDDILLDSSFGCGGTARSEFAGEVMVEISRRRVEPEHSRE